MKTGKVKVLGVQGINKKVYGPGATVTEDNFPEGNFEKLVKEGKIEEIVDKKAQAKQKAEQKKALQSALNQAEDKLAEAKKQLEGATPETEEALTEAVINAEKAVENATNALNDL